MVDVDHFGTERQADSYIPLFSHFWAGRRMVFFLILGILGEALGGVVVAFFS
jgi:hypothetical protein